MEQVTGLNAAQMDFLRLLAHFKTEEQVEELRQVVCDYYARKIDEAVDKLRMSARPFPSKLARSSSAGLLPEGRKNP